MDNDVNKYFEIILTELFTSSRSLDMKYFVPLPNKNAKDHKVPPCAIAREMHVGQPSAQGCLSYSLVIRTHTSCGYHGASTPLIMRLDRVSIYIHVVFFIFFCGSTTAWQIRISMWYQCVHPTLAKYEPPCATSVFVPHWPKLNFLWCSNDHHQSRPSTAGTAMILLLNGTRRSSAWHWITSKSPKPTGGLLLVLIKGKVITWRSIVIRIDPACPKCIGCQGRIWQLGAIFCCICKWISQESVFR